MIQDVAVICCSEEDVVLKVVIRYLAGESCILLVVFSL